MTPLYRMKESDHTQMLFAVCLNRLDSCSPLQQPVREADQSHDVIIKKQQQTQDNNDTANQQQEPKPAINVVHDVNILKSQKLAQQTQVNKQQNQYHQLKKDINSYDNLDQEGIQGLEEIKQPYIRAKFKFNDNLNSQIELHLSINELKVNVRRENRNEPDFVLPKHGIQFDGSNQHNIIKLNQTQSQETLQFNDNEHFKTYNQEKDNLQLIPIKQHDDTFSIQQPDLAFNFAQQHLINIQYQDWQDTNVLSERHLQTKLKAENSYDLQQNMEVSNILYHSPKRNKIRASQYKSFGKANLQEFRPFKNIYKKGDKQKQRYNKRQKKGIQKVGPRYARVPIDTYYSQDFGNSNVKEKQASQANPKDSQTQEKAQSDIYIALPLNKKIYLEQQMAVIFALYCLYESQLQQPKVQIYIPIGKMALLSNLLSAWVEQGNKLENAQQREAFEEKLHRQQQEQKQWQMQEGNDSIRKMSIQGNKIQHIDFQDKSLKDHNIQMQDVDTQHNLNCESSQYHQDDLENRRHAYTTQPEDTDQYQNDLGNGFNEHTLDLQHGNDDVNINDNDNYKYNGQYFDKNKQRDSPSRNCDTNQINENQQNNNEQTDELSDSDQLLIQAQIECVRLFQKMYLEMKCLVIGAFDVDILSTRQWRKLAEKNEEADQNLTDAINHLKSIIKGPPQAIQDLPDQMALYLNSRNVCFKNFQEKQQQALPSIFQENMLERLDKLLQQQNLAIKQLLDTQHQSKKQHKKRTKSQHYHNGKENGRTLEQEQNSNMSTDLDNQNLQDESADQSMGMSKDSTQSSETGIMQGPNSKMGKQTQNVNVNGLNNIQDSSNFGKTILLANQQNQRQTFKPASNINHINKDQKWRNLKLGMKQLRQRNSQEGESVFSTEYETSETSGASLLSSILAAQSSSTISKVQGSSSDGLDLDLNESDSQKQQSQITSKNYSQEYQSSDGKVDQVLQEAGAISNNMDNEVLSGIPKAARKVMNQKYQQQQELRKKAKLWIGQ